MFGETNKERIRRETALSILNGMVAVGDLRYIEGQSLVPFQYITTKAIQLADELLFNLQEQKETVVFKSRK